MNALHLPTPRIDISGLVFGLDSLQKLRSCLLQGRVDDENLIHNDAFWKSNLPTTFEFSSCGTFLPFVLRRYLIEKRLSFVWVGQAKTTKNDRTDIFDARIDIFDGHKNECHQVTLVEPINRANLLAGHPKLNAKAQAIKAEPLMYANTGHAALQAKNDHNLSGVFS